MRLEDVERFTKDCLHLMKCVFHYSPKMTSQTCNLTESTSVKVGKFFFFHNLLKEDFLIIFVRQFKITDLRYISRKFQISTNRRTLVDNISLNINTISEWDNPDPVERIKDQTFFL